jgi:hypothetical protein
MIIFFELIIHYIYVVFSYVLFYFIKISLLFIGMF